jgi:hypothetical protein
MENAAERGDQHTHPIWNAAPAGGGGAPEARHCPNPAHDGGRYQRREVFERWVTPDAAEIDLIDSRLSAFPN